MQRLARNASQSRFPRLWAGLIGAWNPDIARGSGSLPDLSLTTPANGTATNFSGSPFTTTARGVAGKYVSANGTYFNLGNPTKLALLSPYSISIWQQSNSFASYRNLIFKGDGFGAEFGIIINASAQWQAQINTGGAFGDTLIAGKWHHLVVTYDGATILSYRDGLLRTTYGSIANTPRGSAVTLGADSINSRYFDGQIGETLFYNRVLKPVEIAALSAGQSPFIRRRTYLEGKSGGGTHHRLMVIG